MRRRSSSKNRRSRRSRSEDDRSSVNPKFEERDSRRQSWLIQQQRERDHEILKQKMIFEYELKRAALLKTDSKVSKNRPDSFRRSHSRSRSRTKDYREKDRNSKPTIMSEKMESPGGSESLFKGPTSTRIRESELHKIKVDIHRSIQGPVGTRTDLQRGIVNPEEITVKRREDEGQKPLFSIIKLDKIVPLKENEDCRNIRYEEEDDSNQRGSSKENNVFRKIGNKQDNKYHSSRKHSTSVDSSSRYPRRSISVRDCHERENDFIKSSDEGVTPIFDRVELRLPDKSKTFENTELRIVKSIHTEKPEKKSHLSKRRSRSLSLERNRRETSLLRSRRGRDQRSSKRRSYSSDSSSDSERRNRKNGRRERSYDRAGPSTSSHYRDHDHRSSRRISLERSPSRRDLDRLTRIETGSREHQEKSQRYERRRSSERERVYRENRSRERRVPSYSHYLEPIPVPLYYGDFPRPMMMDPMMPMRGPPLMMRNRPNFGPRMPFPPRHMHPGFPLNPGFGRNF